MAHGCQDACCKEGYRKGTYVCGVSSALFSFAITHLHCCQDQQNERIGGLKIERKNGRSEGQSQNVKTSNDRFFSVMTDFPQEIESLGFSGYMNDDSKTADAV